MAKKDFIFDGFENMVNSIASDIRSSSIEMINISDLHNSADNFFEVNRVEELAESILGQGGVKENLIVRPLSEGGYEVISGHRRKAAVQYLIDKGENVSHMLPCLVQNYTDENEKLIDLILMNTSARQLSDAELLQSYEKINDILQEKKSLGEKFGKTREKLAEILQVSSAQVGKMQNIERNAIEPIKEAIKDGKLTISTANEIAKLEEEEQEKLAETANLSTVKPKEIKNIASQATKQEQFTEPYEPNDTNDTEIDCNDTEEQETTDVNEDISFSDKIEATLPETKDDTNINTNKQTAISSELIREYLIKSAEYAHFTQEQTNQLLGGLMLYESFLSHV